MLCVTAPIHAAEEADLRPAADAGPSRYAATEPLLLNGSDSMAGPGRVIQSWHWRQVEGPPTVVSGADTPTPSISGFVPAETVQTVVFELTVGDGLETSAPDRTQIIVVPAYSVGRLTLRNPPFRTTLPTLVTFGGGDCTVGGPMPFADPPEWYEAANIVSGFYEPPYEDQAEWLIVYLSSVAPEYDQQIQTIGFSTGGNPAIMIANHLNSTYQDPRYAVNRVTLIDAVCAIPFASEVGRFQANPVGGEAAWVDTYRVAAQFLNGALNVVFPFAHHATPYDWYRRSISPNSWPPAGAFHGGLTAGAYLSVVGPGRNLRLSTENTPYVFECSGDGIQCLEHRDADSAPGRLPEPVRLLGPDDGAEVGRRGTILSCQPSENAVQYTLLLGPALDDLAVAAPIGAQPPVYHLAELPHDPTYWTIRVTDAHGSTIAADPRRLCLHRAHPRRPAGRASVDP